MINESDLIELRKKGICFFAVLQSCGNCDLTPSDVIKFIADPEKFDADRCGVSLEDYRRWLKARDSLQCNGITKKGKPCRNFILFHGNGEWNPKDFRFGIDDRCHLHREKEET